MEEKFKRAPDLSIEDQKRIIVRQIAGVEKRLAGIKFKSDVRLHRAIGAAIMRNIDDPDVRSFLGSHWDLVPPQHREQLGKILDEY